MAPRTGKTEKFTAPHEVRDAQDNTLYLSFFGEEVPRVGEFITPFDQPLILQVTAVCWFEHKKARGRLFAWLYVRKVKEIPC